MILAMTQRHKQSQSPPDVRRLSNADQAPIVVSRNVACKLANKVPENLCMKTW
jgi:hypothetical protein